MLAMQFHPGQVLTLLNAQQQRVGELTVEGREGDLVLGTFVPGPVFSEMQPLFRAFEKAAEAQALSVVDELDAAIATLHLRLAGPGGAPPVDIHDVQIWSDGGISLRLARDTSIPVNGAAAGGQSARPVQE